MNYRIQFATITIQPEKLPLFSYVASKLTFDTVIYTAIVRAESPEQATSKIRESWPNAQVRYVEEGVDRFRQTDLIADTSYFGTVTMRPRENLIVAAVKAPFMAFYHAFR